MDTSAAFALLVACCRWPPSDRGDDLVRATAADADWATFESLAAHHRVEALVYDALLRTGIEMPDGVVGRFRAASARCAQQSLLLTAESQRVATELTRRGVGHLFLKGASLEMLAYRRLGLKRSRDVDVLVDPAAYSEACDAAEALGYRIAIPLGATRPQILRHARAAKDTVWHHDARRIVLEIHERLTPNPVILAGIDIHAPRQTVEVAPGVSLATFGREPLFAYLCVHGAFTSWSRLKWLADLAALLRDEDAESVTQLYRYAVGIGAGRSAAQALLLARRFFDIPLDPTLEAELRRDRIHLYLERTATRQLLSDDLRGAALNRALFALQPGWRYKSAQFGFKVRAVGRRARGLGDPA